MDAAVYLQEDVLMVLTNAYEKELGLAKELLRQIIENQKIAASEKTSTVSGYRHCSNICRVGNRGYL